MANQNGGQSNSRSLLLLLLTSGFFITGLLFDYMPMLVDNQIKHTLELATNEEIQSIWSKPPIDVHSYFWLYEALNVNDYLTGQKLSVRKVGPFHFTSRPEKRIIELSQNKFRLTYNSSRRFKLNETDLELNEKLNERLTLLNPVYASMLAATKELSLKLNTDQATQRMMATSTSHLADRFNETLFMNMTARQALLGRKLLFLEKARKMLDTFGIEGDAAANLASAPADNIFGYVAIQNNTWSGPYEVYTGYQASVGSLGDLISYKRKRRLTEFRGTCNRLQASAGELRPMPLDPSKRLEMFQPNFCRIVHLRPTGHRKLREGLAYSYVFAEEDFQSAQLNPQNECFCLNDTSRDYCSLNGVLELGPCSSFAPILLSMSHIKLDPKITGSLNNWDQELMESAVELQPAPDKDAQILILRRVGVPIHLDLTYVLFMRIARDPQFRETVSVPEVSYIPAVMVREIVNIPPKLGQILVNLESFLDLTQHLKVIMYLSAIVLLCWLTGNFYSGSSSGASSGRGQQARRAARSTSNLSSASNPNSSSLGDRDINSADSNRSQPPSRRSSLLAELPPLPANGDGNGADRPDDGLEAASISRRASQSRANKTGPSQVTANEPNRLRRARAIPAKIGQLSADLSELEEPHEGGQVKQAAAAATTVTTVTVTANRHSKNWFKQVVSSFVRILGGIGGGANDSRAGPTSSEHLRDKQLEMLAGKIDNWYNSGGGGGGDGDGDGGGGDGPNGTEAAQVEELAVAAAAVVAATAAGQVKLESGGASELEPEPAVIKPGRQVNGVEMVDKATSSDELNPEGRDLAGASASATTNLTAKGKELTDGGGPQQAASSPSNDNSDGQERLLKATANLNVKQFNHASKAVNKMSNTADDTASADESLAEDNQQQADEKKLATSYGNERKSAEQRQLATTSGSSTTPKPAHSDKANALERMEAALIV